MEGFSSARMILSLGDKSPDYLDYDVSCKLKHTINSKNGIDNFTRNIECL